MSHTIHKTNYELVRVATNVELVDRCTVSYVQKITLRARTSHRVKAKLAARLALDDRGAEFAICCCPDQIAPRWLQRYE